MTKFNAETKWDATRQARAWRTDNRYRGLAKTSDVPADAKRNLPWWAALDILELEEEREAAR